MRDGIDTAFYIFTGIEEQKTLAHAEEIVRQGKIVDVHFHKKHELNRCSPNCLTPMEIPEY
jgi:hypothetical protein